jgi:hypothetical protein
MTDIPEKFQNPDGTLNSDTLLKSYSELEKKIGSMITVPDDSSDDSMKEKFNRAVGVPENISSYPNHDLFDDDSLKEKFKDAGLSSRQVEKIYAIAEEFLKPALSKAFADANDAGEVQELREFFGSEEKMQRAMKDIQTFGEKCLPFDAFETMCASVAGIKGIYNMMQSMDPNVVVSETADGELSDSSLRRMMSDPKYWRDHDKEYIRKIENGFKKLYA